MIKINQKLLYFIRYTVPQRYVGDNGEKTINPQNKSLAITRSSIVGRSSSSPKGGAFLDAEPQYH
jgi:hypothetical protein